MALLARFVRSLVRLVMLSVPVALTAACGGKAATSPPIPTAMTMVSGDSQSAVAHDTLGQPLVVQVVDAHAAGVAGVSVTWTIAGPGTSTVSRSVTAQGGWAVFKVQLDTVAGDYTVTASAAALPSVTFAVTCRPGPAAMLRFLVQPAGGKTLTTLSPAVQVAVLDQWGNTVPTYAVNLHIWITVGTGTAGATLSGTTTRATTLGVATFDDLAIDMAGVGYTLAVRCDYPLMGVWSDPFTVSAG